MALWFGALFGLGSLAIRPGLIESFVLSTHLDTIVSAAAPPIGMTARILLALAMTGIGGAIGATIARRIARPRVQAEPRRRSARMADAGQAPRPLARTDYALSDEADSAADDDLRAGQKRRSLAVPEDNTPPEYREYAPLPGGPLVLDLAELESTEPDRGASVADILGAPGRAAAPVSPSIPELPPVAPLPEPVSARVTMEAAKAIAPEPAARLFDAPRDLSPAALAPEVPAPLVEEAAPAAAFPQSMFEHKPLFAQPDAPAPKPLFGDPAAVPSVETVTPPVATIATAPTAPQPRTAPVEPSPAPFVVPGEAAAAQLVGAELDELSPVQLVERLAITLKRRRERPAPVEPSEAAPIAVPDTHPLAAFLKPDVATPRFPDEAPAPAMAAEPAEAAPAPLARLVDEPAPIPDAAPKAVPAALRPLALGHDDLGEDDPLASVTRRHIALPQGEAMTAAAAAEGPSDQPEPQNAATVMADDAESAQDSDETADDDSVDAGYSSLLNLSKPIVARQEFIRIEEDEPAGEIEPVVTFPGHATRREGLPVVPEITGPAFDSAVEETAFTGARRFDAPGQTAAASLDKEESERALRAALATLQRMSGAA